MSDTAATDAPDLPEPTVDPEPPRAPGGPDASPNESDPGSTVSAEERAAAVIPDPPFSAQRDEDDIPEAIQEGEPSDEPGAEPDDAPEAQAEEPPV